MTTRDEIYKSSKQSRQEDMPSINWLPPSSFGSAFARDGSKVSAPDILILTNKGIYPISSLQVTSRFCANKLLEFFKDKVVGWLPIGNFNVTEDGIWRGGGLPRFVSPESVSDLMDSFGPEHPLVVSNQLLAGERTEGSRGLSAAVHECTCDLSDEDQARQERLVMQQEQTLEGKVRDYEWMIKMGELSSLLDPMPIPHCQTCGGYRTLGRGSV